MKTLILTLIAISITGCATAQSRWSGVSNGQSRDEVIHAMGEPMDAVKENGQDVLVWQMDAFAICGVMLSNDGHVVGKSCKDDAEGRAQATTRMLQTRVQNQAAYHPVQGYQPARPIQMNCKTRWVGSNAISDCTGREVGLDTSIYR